MKLRLTDYRDNVYEDTDGSCELCMWTGMIAHPEFEFTVEGGDTYTVEGWYCDWGHLTTRYDINVPVFTTWLHGVEFKSLREVREELDKNTDGQYHPGVFVIGKVGILEYIEAILDSASYRGTKEELNEALDWALKGENNAD